MWVLLAVELGEKEKSEVQISEGNKGAGSAVFIRGGVVGTLVPGATLPLLMENLLPG